MNHPTYSFYDPATGLFTGRQFTGSLAAFNLNCPPGMLAVLGQHDPLSRRVDVAQDRVVDYLPPSPGEDYEWNAQTKRWVLGSAAQQKVDADIAARARLADIDSQSIRALREAAIGDKAATALLADLEAQAVTLRVDVIATPIELDTPQEALGI